MKPQTQLERLIAAIEARGALMDGLASGIERHSPDTGYPRLFSELVTKHAFTAFVVGGVRVCSNLLSAPDNLQKLLADAILTHSLSDAGFSPFGQPASGNYDRVCFDMRGRMNPFDAPVVVMDHEAILSHNRVPRPRRLANGLMHLFDLETLKTE